MSNITALPDVKPESVEAKRKFLKEHFRYHTMNSWNRSHSYAVNIKVSRLNLTNAQRSACYGMLYSDEAQTRFGDALSCLADETNWAFQIGVNGRSGGYAVLYTGGREPSGYKSYCRGCGQKNYKSVGESGTRCGACGEEERVDFAKPHTRPYTNNAGLDQGEDFDDVDVWDDEKICGRFEEVWAFDETVESACRDFLDFALSHKLVEKTVMVPKKIMVAEEIDAGAEVIHE